MGFFETIEQGYDNLTTPLPNETPEGKWHQEQVEKHKKTLRSDPNAERPEGMSREIDAETRSSIEWEKNQEEWEANGGESSDRLYGEIKAYEEADYEMARREIEEMSKSDPDIPEGVYEKRDEKDS